MSKTPYEEWKTYLDAVAWPKGLKVSYEYRPDSIGFVFYKENWLTMLLVDMLMTKAIAEETAEYIQSKGTQVYMRYEDA